MGIVYTSLMDLGQIDIMGESWILCRFGPEIRLWRALMDLIVLKVFNGKGMFGIFIRSLKVL